MTQPDRPLTIKQRARQGDRAAIAQVIQDAIAHKQITAKVVFDAHHLDIYLEAETTPDQQATTTLLHRELLRLNLPGSTTITISGRQTAALQADWVQALPLETTPNVSIPGPQSARPSQSKQHQKPFILTFNDVWQFLARFNPLKLGCIACLALYGLFGASHYTVDGFLDGSDPIMMFLHGVNLIFHEAGHTILLGFGEFLHILGGSLMQVMVPVVIAGYFVATRQMYAGAIALCWAAQNLWDVSIYIQDAQERSLPLLGGENVLHDWHFLLLDMNLLAKAQLVSGFVFFLGSVLYLVAIGAGLYFARVDNSTTSPSP